MPYLFRAFCFGAAWLGSAGSACASEVGDAVACLVGIYDGGQMEVAASLELGADGRFAYRLSYGALDEEAQGSWKADAGDVYLNSDPVSQPDFVLISEEPSADGGYHVLLDLPEGMSPQYFEAEIELKDGRVARHQLSEDDLIYDFAEAETPVRIRLRLGVFDLDSPAFAVSGRRDAQVRIRFEPNDLGKVDFRDTPLQRDGAELLLERQGLGLRFRPSGGDCPAD